MNSTSNIDKIADQATQPQTQSQEERSEEFKQQKRTILPESWRKAPNNQTERKSNQTANPKSNKGSEAAARPARELVPKLKPLRVIGNGAFGKS